MKLDLHLYLDNGYEMKVVLVDAKSFDAFRMLLPLVIDRLELATKELMEREALKSV